MSHLCKIGKVATSHRVILIWLLRDLVIKQAWSQAKASQARRRSGTLNRPVKAKYLSGKGGRHPILKTKATRRTWWAWSSRIPAPYPTHTEFTQENTTWRAPWGSHNCTIWMAFRSSRWRSMPRLEQVRCTWTKLPQARARDRQFRWLKGLRIRITIPA